MQRNSHKKQLIYWKTDPKDFENAIEYPNHRKWCEEYSKRWPEIRRRTIKEAIADLGNDWG